MQHSCAVLFIIAGLIPVISSQSDLAPAFNTSAGSLIHSLTNNGIKENLARGTVLGVLDADVEGVPNAVITFDSVQKDVLGVYANGTVYVSQDLDREDAAVSGNIYRLTLTATYQSETTTFTVPIYILDENDNPPIFQNGPYSVEVAENTVVGTTIYTGVSVVDIDTGEYNKISFSCQDSTNQEEILACNTFSIVESQNDGGNYNGLIVLEKPLDYESIKSYSFTILAVDNPDRIGENQVQNSASINMLITVGDQDDTNPIFLNAPIALEVLENSPFGTVVGPIRAQDGDTGNRRPIRIVSLDAQKLFAVSNTVLEGNGIYISNVTVNGSIDREALNFRYIFDVMAIELDNGIETNQTTTTSVSVTIRDEDDNIPTFDKPFYNISIPELDSSGSGSTVEVVPSLTMRITDPDEASYGNFLISIVSETPESGLFNVSRTTGSRLAQVYLVLLQREKLNYENVAYRKMDVIVKAEDANNPLRSSTALITINLEDANDNNPIFPQDVYYRTVSENENIGYTVITITATDADSGSNGALIYSLRGTGVEKFDIGQSTGIITLKEKLDFEATSSYNILVVANDQGVPSKETSVKLNVTVLNYNDVAPVFTQNTYNTSVNEDETDLLIPITVRATDSEPGTVITYRISDGNLGNKFTINPSTGVLGLLSSVVYSDTPNQQGYFNLTVEASDNGAPAQRVYTTIYVTVNDINNNVPVFLQSIYTATISETAVNGSLVKKVSATDQDVGSNGNVVYRIWSGGFDDFTIDSLGNVRVSSIAKLDVDAIGIYNVTLHAVDLGNSPQTGTATLSVTLTDDNNKNPTFERSFYSGNVLEDQPNGTFVLTVLATDPDSNSLIQYSIDSNSIIAKDINDNQIFSTFPFNYKEAFRIEGTSGIIRTNAKLLRSEAAEVSFSVVARDLNAALNAIQTATAEVLITILGSPDPTPYFMPPWSVGNPTYSLSLHEETPVGKVFTTLIAKEGDSNNVIQNYQKVVGTDPGNYFDVNMTTGEIKTARLMDYDTLNDKILQFQVVAISSDGLRSAVANMLIQVLDINDNAPVFVPDQSNLTFSVPENLGFPSRIGTITARDADSGSNSEIVFSLAGEGASNFTVLNTGALIVANGTVLDYETTRSYKMTLFARDNPGAGSTSEQNQASLILIINVEDLNDNPPIFEQPSYTFTADESFNLYTRIDVVRATDADSGVNKEITYRFSQIDPEAFNMFSISEDSGVIVNIASLGGKSALSPFHMVVEAANQNLFSYVNVTIVVSSGQLDNGLPVWSRPVLGQNVTNVTEHAPNGTVVATAVAGVRTPGGVAVYSFLMDSLNPIYGKFHIDPSTGLITVSGDLDREEQAVYDLILLATDSLNATLQSTRLLTIQLQDIDDQRPSFEDCPNKQYEVPQLVSIQEGEPAGSYVYRAEACDIDTYPNNAVQYQIFAPLDHPYCYSNVSSFFRVNSSTGVVTTLQMIDREATPSFLVCVHATQAVASGRRKRATLQEYIDNLDRRTDVLYLLVTISDLNDEGPSFPTFTPSDLYTYVFGFPDKDNIIQYVANDPDAVPYNRVRYSITNIEHITYQGSRRPIFGAFIINHDTGEISVGFPSYKAFDDGYFEVTVKAEDFYDPTKSDTVTFKIYVGDAMRQVRFVLDTTNVDQSSVDTLVRNMETAQPGYKFLPTQIRYHKTSSGTVASQTDVCMFVVQDNRVIDAYDGTTVLQSQSVGQILSRVNAVDPGPCEPATTRDLEGSSAYWWVLVAFAIFIFIVTAILMYAIWALYKDYKTYMETRKTYLVQG